MAATGPESWVEVISPWPASPSASDEVDGCPVGAAAGVDLLELECGW